MNGMNGCGEGSERHPPIPPIRLPAVVQETMQPEKVTLWLKLTSDRIWQIPSPGAKRSETADDGGR